MADWPAFLSRDLVLQGSALALADPSGDLSRAELDSRVRLWAALLARRNLLPGDRVLLLLPQGVDSWLALLAVLALGATAIPVSPGLPAGELRQILRLWRPAACLVRGAAGPETGLDPDAVIALDSLPRRWPRARAAEGAGPPGGLRFAGRAQILLPGGALAGEAGCLHGIESLLANARRLLESLVLAPGLPGLLALPPSHWAGLLLGLGLIAAGRPVWLSDPEDLAAPPEEWGAFVCFSGLAPWRRRLARPASAGFAAPIRHLVTPSGTVSRALLEQSRACIGTAPFDLVHGSALHLALTRLRIGSEAPAPGCIGHPLPGTSLRVLRRPLREARPGQAGYLVPTGDGGSPCLPGRDSPAMPASDLPFDQHEIGWQDAEGCLFRLPSPKDLIRTAGHVLAPEALEQQVLDSGLVEDAFAFGIPHPDLQEAVVLVAVPRPRVTPHQLREFCRETLPGFMVPHRIELHARLPAVSLARSGRHYLRLRYAGLYGAL